MKGLEIDTPFLPRFGTHSFFETSRAQIQACIAHPTIHTPTRYRGNVVSLMRRFLPV